MNEKQRILNLLKEGRITSEEAVMLLEAIEEPAPAPRGNPNWGGEFSRAAREVQREVSREAAEIAREARDAAKEGSRIAREITRVFRGPTPPTPPEPPMAPNPPVVVVYGDEGARPEGLRWVEVNLTSGDLEVRHDPGLQRPVIGGDIEALNIQENGETIKVSSYHGHRRKGSTKFLGMNITWDFDEGSGGEPEIVLPAGWGLEVRLQSGDLSVEGVEHLRGEVMSGDVRLEGVGAVSLNVYSGDLSAQNLGLLQGAVYSGDVSLEGVRGVDLEVSSGDLSAELRLTEGQHRLSVMSGDVSLNLGGSSVRLEGRVSSGEIHLGLPDGAEFSRQKRTFRATLGEGAAHLKINVDSGDLTLEAE